MRFPVLRRPRPGVGATRSRCRSTDFGGEEPYEDRRVHDPELFRTFADRAAPLWQNWGFEPLLPRVWKDIAEHPAATIGEQFARVRRTWERRWGCHNLELPVSRLSQTEAFARFASHILADLPRFRDAYNAAVRAYRSANGIESHNHPVPGPGRGRGAVLGAGRPATAAATG